MKFTCPREQLAEAMSLVGSVVPTRTTKDIIRNIRMTAESDSLLLEATDLEVGIRFRIDKVVVEREGATLINCQRAIAILRESIEESVTVDSSEKEVLIRTSRSKYQLRYINPAEFPRVPPFNEEKCHEASTAAVRELLRRTMFATDQESTRYALGGVLLEMDGNRIEGVGTDGRRLATMQIAGTSKDGHQTTANNCIVPTRSAALIERALGNLPPDGTIRLAARASDFVVATTNATITTRLVEGRYPQWRQVIPQRSGGIKLNLIVGPLFAALRQAAIVSDSENHGIDMSFREGVLNLEANAKEVGEAHVDLPVVYDGEPFTLTVDHRYATDFCRVLPLEASFTFEVDNPERPALLSTEDGYRYVIMPMARTG
jgi:DNA polymerase III subunit beta